MARLVLLIIVQFYVLQSETRKTWYLVYTKTVPVYTTMVQNITVSHGHHPAPQQSLASSAQTDSVDNDKHSSTHSARQAVGTPTDPPLKRLQETPDSSLVDNGLCATLARCRKMVTPARLLLLSDAMCNVVPGTNKKWNQQQQQHPPPTATTTSGTIFQPLPPTPTPCSTTWWPWWWCGGGGSVR